MFISGMNAFEIFQEPFTTFLKHISECEDYQEFNIAKLKYQSRFQEIDRFYFEIDRFYKLDI